jgi:polysaccharide biosynthesis transport protein
MERDRNPEEIRFDQYWLTLKRHRWPAGLVFGLTVLAAGLLSTQEKPLYEAEGKLLFRKRDRTSSLLSSDTNRQSGDLEALNNQNTPIDTEAEVLRSLPLAEKVIAQLNLKDKVGQPLTAETLVKNLAVKGVKGTDVLQVSYKSRNPKEAAAIVNELIKTYIGNNVEVNREEATAARTFIAKQLPAIQSKLETAEASLRDFEEQNQVVSLPDEAKTSVETVALLSEKIATAQATANDANTRATALRERVGRTPNAAMVLNTLNQSAGVQQALTDLQKIETELASQRTLYRDNHPTVQALARKQQSLNVLLRQRVQEVIGGDGNVDRADLQVGLSEQKLIDGFIEAEVVRRGVNSQLTALVQARDAYQNRSNRLPRLQQQRRALERQVVSLQTNYEALLKRYQEVQILENQNLGVARVVASATVPNAPMPSKQKLMLMGGSVVGALLYVLTAFALDLRDPSLKTAKDAREQFAYASLGMIPFLRRKGRFGRNPETSGHVPELPVVQHPNSLSAAAYRMLQSNLKFLNPDRRVKTIAVTSAIGKEGKSTVAANLAAALGQMGHRVLLLDVDFYRPIQHRIWELGNTFGLSNVIMSQVSPDQVINRVQENLDVMTAGTLPPNPLALVDSKRMHSLMAEFAEQYDYVICDTPPLVLASDVVALGRLADGVMLVVRPGVIDSHSANEAKTLLAQSNLEVLGIVTNGVAIDEEPDSYLRRAREYYESVPNAALTPV